MISALMAVSLVAAGLFGWGLLQLRRGRRQAFRAAREVDANDIPHLLDECITGFGRLGERIDLADPLAATDLLDRYLVGNGSLRLKLAFARPGSDWYFVLPAGALLGEILCRHTGGAWQPTDGGGLCVVLPAGEGTATAHPFEKIVTQATGGDAGAIGLYVAAARAFGEVPSAAGSAA